MENYTESKYLQAKNSVTCLRKFYLNLLAFIIVSGVIIFTNYSETGSFANPFKNSVIILIWGIILTIKAIKLFFLNSNWENNMINKELKNKNNANRI